MSRVKLLRNKRENALKQMRRDIASLLQSGQEPSAQIRVENIMREQNILGAYDVLELYCELVVVRLPIIESQKECPPDMREALASIIFAAPRCADLPELMQARHSMQQKYGKDFLAAADELRPGCAVSRIIIDKLSVHAPPGESKLKLLKEIAEEAHLDWDSTATEEALLRKPKLDLLDAPQPLWQPDETPGPLPFNAAGPSAPPKSVWVDPELVDEDVPSYDPSPQSGPSASLSEDSAMAEYQKKRDEERERKKAGIRSVAETAIARTRKALDAVRSATHLTERSEVEQGEEEGGAGGYRKGTEDGRGQLGGGSRWDGEESYAAPSKEVPRGYVRGPAGEEGGGGPASTGTKFDDYVAHSGGPPVAAWGSGPLDDEEEYGAAGSQPLHGQGAEMDDLDVRFRILRDRSGRSGMG